jgi:hypothetical protein
MRESRMETIGRLTIWLQNFVGLFPRLINIIKGMKASFKEFFIPFAAASRYALELYWATVKKGCPSFTDLQQFYISLRRR